MKFSLATIAYIFALLAAGMALFGPWGILPAAFVLGLRAHWRAMPTSFTLTELLVVIAVGGLLLGLMLPGGHDLRPMRQGRCVRQLEDLAMAVLHFKRRHGRLPEDFHTSSGKDLSWRVEVMPDVCSGTEYADLGLGKDWDGKNVAQLRDSAFALKCSVWNISPSGNVGTYFRVLGKDAYGSPGTKSTSNQSADYPSETIMLLEANRDIALWFEPRDLTFDEAVELLTTTPRWEEGDGHYVAHGLFTKPSVTRNVAFADGSVRALRTPLSRDLAVALLTAHGGEQISNELLDKLSRPQFNYERCYAFAAFIVLACLPARWLKSRKTSGTGREPKPAIEK